LNFSRHGGRELARSKKSYAIIKLPDVLQHRGRLHQRAVDGALLCGEKIFVTLSTISELAIPGLLKYINLSLENHNALRLLSEHQYQTPDEVCFGTCKSGNNGYIN